MLKIFGLHFIVAIAMEIIGFVFGFTVLTLYYCTAFDILTFFNVWLPIIWQEQRACDWEWFEGRCDLMLQLGNYS